MLLFIETFWRNFLFTYILKIDLKLDNNNNIVKKICFSGKAQFSVCSNYQPEQDGALEKNTQNDDNKEKIITFLITM